MNDNIEDRENAREAPVTEASDTSIIIDNTPKCTENPLSAGEKKTIGSPRRVVIHIEAPIDYRLCISVVEGAIEYDKEHERRNREQVMSG